MEGEGGVESEQVGSGETRCGEHLLCSVRGPWCALGCAAVGWGEGRIIVERGNGGGGGGSKPMRSHARAV